MIPWKFCKDLLNTDLENWFWKFRKKYRFLKKSKKIRPKWQKWQCFFWYFLNTRVLRKAGMGETWSLFEKMWKSLHPTGQSFIDWWPCRAGWSGRAAGSGRADVSRRAGGLRGAGGFRKSWKLGSSRWSCIDDCEVELEEEKKAPRHEFHKRTERQ
jgi:hypothetical protein